MSHIVVTGSNGQLGKSIQEISAQFEDLTFTFFDATDLDITSLDSVMQAFSNQHFDYCINCAAYTAVDKAELETEKAYLVNAFGAENLAKACKRHDTVLIHVSTDFVFDGNKQEPYTENDIPNPLNIYGKSKLEGERLIEQVLNNHYIIRTSWVYSKYGNNFVKTMLRLAAERDELNIVNDQVGSPTFAGDLAHQILEMINCKTQPFGLYHFSNKGTISWFEFAEEIFKLTNNTIKINPIKAEFYKTPALRPRFSVLDNTKITSNFQTKSNLWKESLKQVLNEISYQQK